MPVVVLPESSIPTVTVDTQNNNSSVEAIHYIGNKKSKVYHKENCSSVKSMKDENKVCFNSIEEAKDADYNPCGVCLK